MCSSRALNAEHEEVETLIVDRHEQRKRAILSNQDETVSAEKSLSSLEYSLEDLLQRYAALRDQSTNMENVCIRSCSKLIVDVVSNSMNCDLPVLKGTKSNSRLY